MDPYNHSTPISTKLPILNIRKFEQWKFRIQQYLQHENYALWKVIEFGDSYKAPPEETAKDKGLACEVSSSTKKKGRTVAITVEDMQKRKNNVKERTTLLLALPDEHQLRFIKYDSAKELWEAILKNFGRNEATKKTKKNQLKQQYGNFKAEGSETLEQTFNRKSEVPTVQGASTASAQVSAVSTDVAAASLSYDTREERESYKKDPKVEEHAPKEMIAINGIRWDWSYMAEEDEASKNHALVADEEEVPTEYALMAKSSSSSDNKTFKESKLDKDIKGVGFNEYCVVLPPPAQVYSPPKKDLSWIGLPEFVNDTVTDYTRPTPSIDVSKSVSKEQEERWKSNNPSFFEQGGSSGNVVSKPMIKFVKESGCPNATKVNNTKKY
nr:hypothetical protein [Tanacetum cinerariifolium]